MADEVQFALQLSSKNLYFAVRNSAGSVWDTGTTTFVAITSITWSDADIALSEQGSTGDYYGDFPAGISAGQYTIEIFERVGASPVRKDDILLGTFEVIWKNSRLLTVNQALGEMVEDDSGTFRYTTNALEQAAGGGGGASAGDIADAVLDELLSEHTDSGSLGERLGRIPNAAAGDNGGLPTVNGSNYIAGIAGTKNQLDDLSDPTASQVADQVWDEALGDHTSSGSAGERLGRIPNAAPGFNEGLPTVDANNRIAGIQGTITHFDGLENLSTSDIDARLAAIGLDHLVSAAVSGTDVADDSIMALLVSSSATADWDTFDNTTDSLQAIADGAGGGGASAEAIADAVWDEARAGHTTAGTFGETLGTVESNIDNLDAAVSSRSSLDAADVNAEVDTALSDIGLDHLVSAAATGTDITDDSIIAQLVSAASTADWDTFDNETDSLQAIADGAGGGGASAGAVADAVLDELLSEHTTAGSLGERLSRIPNAAAGGNGGLPTVNGDNYVAGIQGTKNTLDDLTDVSAASVADSVWDETRTDHNTGGSMGETLNTVQGAIGNLDAAVSSRSTLDTADVNAEVDQALIDIGLDHLVSAAVSGTDVTDNSIIAQLVSSSATADWDTFDNTTDSLEGIADGGAGSGPTAGSIADAVLDELLSEHTDSGSLGERLGRIPNADAGDSGGLPTVDASNFIAGIQGTANTLDDLNDPTAAAVADSVWDAARADHTTAGTFGETLGSVESNIDNLDATVSSRLAAADAPANFDALGITLAGEVSANVQALAGTTINEATAGRIAGNFETFFENADAATAKTLDDVGTNSGSATTDIATTAARIANRFIFVLGRLSDGITARNKITVQSAHDTGLAMDFRHWLAPGEQLDTVVSVVDVDGVLSVDAGSIVYEQVRARVSGGVNGTDYRIRFRATTTQGNTLDAEGILQVRDT